MFFFSLFFWSYVLFHLPLLCCFMIYWIEVFPVLFVPEIVELRSRFLGTTLSPIMFVSGLGPMHFLKDGRFTRRKSLRRQIHPEVQRMRESACLFRKKERDFTLFGLKQTKKQSIKKWFLLDWSCADSFVVRTGGRHFSLSLYYCFVADVYS